MDIKQSKNYHEGEYKVLQEIMKNFTYFNYKKIAAKL